MTPPSGLRRWGDYLAAASVLLAQPVLTLPAGSRTPLAVLLAAALVLQALRKEKDGEGRVPAPVAALLALSCAGLGLLLPAAWWPGLALAGLGAVLAPLPLPVTRRASRAGLRVGAVFLAASLAAGPVRLAMSTLEGWAPAGWSAWLLGRLAGLELSLRDGWLVLRTPLEHQPFPVLPEWTGFPVWVLSTVLALAWWGGRPRRLPALAAALAGIQLGLGAAFLVTCQWGVLKGFFELPWQPLLWIAAGLPGLALAMALLPSPDATAARADRRPPAAWELPAAVAGLALLLLAALGEPRGERKAGRLLIDDGHSDWEWVDEPMTPDVFGSKSTYNYHGLGILLERHYRVSTTRAPLTREALGRVDVLILKTPTRPYAPEEIDAVHEFVAAGGGLYLISDHTNIFGMSTWLDPVSRPLGFTFNHDAVFDLWTRSDQLWRPEGPLPHPAAAGLESYRFLTSCSIRLGWRARPVLASSQVGASWVCYHASNFFDPHPPRAEFRFGTLVQLAAAKKGLGRVLGFSDSTTYSNFAMFWPGRLEQLLASLEWLNHRNPRLPWTWPVGLAGLLAIGALAWRSRLRPLHWLAALLAAACLALPLLRLANRVPPPPRIAEPATASLDAGLSQATFPLLDKLDPQDPLNLETFHIWLHRSGLLPELVADSLPAASRLHVVVNPARVPDAAAQARFRRFLEGGGRLVVALRPSFYTPGLNAWLEPLGAAFGTRLVQHQAVALGGAGDSVWVDEALGVQGGEAFVRDRLGHALATEVVVGKGRLVVSGLGEWFSTARLGSYDSVPEGLARETVLGMYRHVGIEMPAGAGSP